MLTHDKIEKNVTLLIVLVLLVVSVGGLVQIVPLYFQKSTTEPVAGLKPYNALQLTGRDVYIREGCYNCHSQMIRPFRAETERYGHYSVAGEFVYDHPFQWGSKRTGPDLARVGGRYSDEWHRVHLANPRDVVPESNMPAYPWLARTPADAATIAAKMKALRAVGVPYTDAEIGNAAAELKDRTEEDALVAYLQGLGVAMRSAQMGAAGPSQGAHRAPSGGSAAVQAASVGAVPMGAAGPSQGADRAPTGGSAAAQAASVGGRP